MRRRADRVRERPRRRRNVAVALVAVLVCGAALVPGAAALTVDKADVAFNPKKTDSFAVKGQVVGLVPAAIASVEIDFGDFSQTIPIADFTLKNGKLSFKGPKNVPGLATLTIDTVKGKFAASAKGLTLAPFDDPAPLRLVAGAFDECSTLTFTESKKKWKLAGVVPACGFQGVPSADPATIFVSTPTDVRVQVSVIDDLALDLSSLVVLHLDPTLHPIGNPLCTLYDDGSAAHGDDSAFDGIFSCKVTFSEQQPAHIRLAVQALRGVVLVLSPSFFLDVVPPLTDDAVTTIMDGQQAAGDVWEDALGQLGDTKKARKQAVAGILALPGVVNAGVTKDGFSVFIQYENGLEGGLNLDPTGTPGAGVLPVLADLEPSLEATSVKMIAGRSPTSLGASLATSFGRSSADVVAGAGDLAAAAATREGPRIDNNKVLIWNPFPGEAKVDRIQTVFQDADCPHFDVTVLEGDQCTLESVKTFADYGTVVIVTHGAPLPGGDVAFMSGQKATLRSEYFTYAEDIELGRVLVYNGARRPEKKDYFVFRPSFVTNSIGGRFPNSVIFAAACSSTANRTMANAFLAKGAQAYLGFASPTFSGADTIAAEVFFKTMLKNAESVAGTYADSPKNGGELLRKLTSLDSAILAGFDKKVLAAEFQIVLGDGRVAYPCEPPPPGLVDTVTVTAAPGQHGVGKVKLTAGHYRMVITGTTRVQLDADGFDSDAIYCYTSSVPSSPCAQPGGFPNVATLAFYLQSGDETPGFSDLEDPIEFSSPRTFPPLNDGHRYEFGFTAGGGTRLWAQAWFHVIPSTEQYSGSFTIQIFRD